MVHLCMLSVHVGWHHMAELLVIIKVLKLKISFLASTVTFQIFVIIVYVFKNVYLG